MARGVFSRGEGGARLVGTTFAVALSRSARLSTYAAAVPAGLALIASGDEWSARALESVLQPAGYRVQRVFTGAGAQELARSLRPDVILIATPLPDLDGLELCRALRHDPFISPALPIVGIGSAPAHRAQRLSWLRAGAWDFLGLPLDQEELLLKLDAFRYARRDAAETAFVDRATGLYTGGGLERRARELVAEALRLHAALACVVFGPEVGPAERAAKPGAPGLAAVRARVGSVLRAEARLSDTIGWWNGAEFAILALATDADGAVQLARRLARALETVVPESSVPGPALDVRVGYEAVTDVHATPLEPETLLTRASAALQLARARADGPRIRRFEQAP